MKATPRTKRCFSLLLVSLLLSSTQAEVYTPVWSPVPEDLFVVLKSKEYQQLGPGFLSLFPGSPYFFEAFVAPSYLNDSITADPFIEFLVDDVMSSETLMFDGASYEYIASFPIQAGLDLAFPDGTEYTLTIPINEIEESVTFIIDANMSEVTFFPQPEITGLTNAYWEDGILFIPNPSVTTILELNISALDEIFQEGFDLVLAVLDGKAKFSRDLISSLAIGPGGDFELEPGYHMLLLDYVNVIQDFYPTDPITDFTGFVGYDSLTSISIYVIPEPQTYALIIGGIALAGVSFHRFRRKRAAK